MAFIRRTYRCARGLATETACATLPDVDPVTRPLGDEVQVWRIPLDVAPNAQREALATLSAEERKRADAFLRPQDRARWPLARAGMRRILAAQLDRAPDSLVFQTDANGKPWLAEAQGLGFNLSHSDGWALLAITQGVPVGVDLEWMRPLTDLDGMLVQVLTPEERAALPVQGREAAFFRAWVHKEALVKGMGMGLSRALSSLPLAFQADGEVHAEGWISRPLGAPPGYAAAVAVPAPARSVQMRDGPNCQGVAPFPA